MIIAHRKSRMQAGYILLSVMLLMTLMLIALSLEVPRIRQQIKREKEEELIHRAHEYTGAIKRFYRKFGRYPLSVEQLENTNNLRFLRKRYKDPMTGKDDWRLIHQGEAMLKVPGSGGAVSVNAGGNNTFGQPIGGTNPGASFGQTPSPTPTPQGSTGISSGINAGNTTSSSPGGSSGSAFGNFQPGGGPIIGVASTRKEESIKILNEKDHYHEWEFVYDQRFEGQLGGMNVPNNPNSGNVMGGGPPGGNTNLNNPSPSPTPTPPPGGISN